jgi:antitoxin HigA-1
LKVSRQTLNAILHGEAPVTAAMALRLGKLCGNGPELWVNLQARYDLDRLSRELGDELADIPTLNAA